VGKIFFFFDQGDVAIWQKYIAWREQRALIGGDGGGQRVNALSASASLEQRGDRYSW